METRNFIDYVKNSDTKDYFEDKEIETEESAIYNDNIEEYLQQNVLYKEKSILGIDIYQYSQYELSKQTLIPMVFDLLIDETLNFINDETLFLVTILQSKMILYILAMVDSLSLIIHFKH